MGARRGCVRRGEGYELFKKMALCTIVTRLDAPTWKRKSSVSIFFVACLSWNSPPTARKGAALLCVFENIVARRDSCMRDNDRKLVALTCARSFAIDGENKSRFCDEYFSLFDFLFFNTISPEVNCLKDFHFFFPTPVIFNYSSFFRFIIGLGSIRLFVCS